MSSLEGYKPEDSLLIGGEGVTINPSQAGGYIQMGGTFEDEKDLIQGAAAVAYLQALQQQPDNPMITDTVLNAIAIEAAKYTADSIKAKKAVLSNDEDLETLEPDEEVAANKAIAAIPVDQIPKDDVGKAELIRKTAIAAVLKVRNDKRIQLKATRTAFTSKMITPLQNQIQEISKTNIYTEFYHITVPKRNEFDNVYTVRLSEIDNVKFKISMVTYVDKYKQQRLKQWQSVFKITGGKVNPIIPAIKEGDIGENEIIREYSRFVYCLPYDLQRIIIVPPIRGDHILFTNTLFRLKEIGAISYKKLSGNDVYKIKRDTVIVFMPPFYSKLDPSTSKTNITLFSMFIDMNRNNPNQVFILSESTPNYYAIGIGFSQFYSKLDILKSSPLTMLEPSYIIYPYERFGNPEGFIISGSTDAEKVNIPGDVYNIYNLYTNKDYGKALGIAVKPQISGAQIVEGALNTHTIRSGNPPSSLTLKKSDKYSTTACSGLLDSPVLNKIFKKLQFNFQKITLDGNLVDALFVLQLNPTGSHVPICSTRLPEGPDPLSKNDLHYSTDKHNNTLLKTQMLIKGNMYSIRNYNEDVNDDWKKRIFTKDEADFLNRTRLLPGVLDDVFGASWPNYLALFLRTLSESKCMTDTALLTKSECYYNRNFLERVHAYFVENTLRINLIKDEEDNDRQKHLYDFVDENEVPPVSSIDTTNVREARDDERNLRKLVFGEINSYTHTGNASHPINERRALVIGVNRKTGLHKFYIISTPSDLTDGNKANEEAKLINIVEKDLPNKYKDFVFIY
jgi:hypothetical protein